MNRWTAYLVLLSLVLGSPAFALTLGTITHEGVRLTAADVGMTAPDGPADPSGYVLPDGRIRLYVGGFSREVSVVSSDGLTFTAESGSRYVSGRGAMGRVFTLPDGSIRVFYFETTDIVSAVSSDGLTFTRDLGTRLAASAVGASLISPFAVVPISGGYRAYFSDLGPAGGGVYNSKVYSAISSDMLTWTLEAGVRIGTGSGAITRSASHPDAIVNADGSVTVFYCNNLSGGPSVGGPENIYYATSTDGLTFPAATEVQFTFTGCDPHVVKLADGSYRLYWNKYDPTLGTRISSSTFAGIVTPAGGWWWNAAESGRGFSLERRGTNLFLSTFLYAADGTPTWYASMMSGATSAGPFTGTLGVYGNGQTLAGTYRAADYLGSLGDVSLSFSAPNAATLVWPGGTLALSRFGFTGTLAGQPPNYPETGWWWASSESGRGYFLEVQGTTMFLGGYMYDDRLQPIWYVATGPMTSTSLFEGTLHEYSGGQTLTGTYQAPTAAVARGAISVSFSSTTAGTLTFPNGSQVAIQRFQF